MNKIIFINNEGVVEIVMSPAHDDAFINGEKYGEHTAVHVSTDIDDHDFILSKYYKDGEFKERVPNPVTISTVSIPADGETPVTFHNASGRLIIDMKEYAVEDEEIELTFDTPGEYHIRLEAFSYLPFEAVIHAY